MDLEQPCIMRITVDDSFFDLIDIANNIWITDYHSLKKNIIENDDGDLEFKGEKQKREIITFENFKSELNNIILSVVQYFKEMHVDLEIDDRDRNLTVEQVIFDILFDKYLKESTLMTRSGYSSCMAKKLGEDFSFSHAINERITRGMKVFCERNMSPILRNQLEHLGTDPEEFVKYYTYLMKDNSSKKKPKFIWDQLYYNFCLPITNRQYRRQLTRENRNYSYEEIYADFQDYKKFVDRLLPHTNESPKKYYTMSMEYYLLKSYKRVDFISKLIFLKVDSCQIHKDHYLVKRFHPCVLFPYEEDGKSMLSLIHKYYRPLLWVEEKLQKEIDQSSDFENSIYASRLLKIQILRAKTYELFRYHCSFVTYDYSEIKRFLSQCYNMRLYHESNSLWELIADKGWKRLDSDLKSQLQKFMRDFLSINQAFFGE